MEDCGHGWQEEYAALHKSIINGDAPQRFLVAQGLGGFTNVLYGAVSLFYVAMHTKRAFVLDLYNHSEALYEWAFDQPTINWTFDAEKGIVGSSDYYRLFSLYARQQSEKDEWYLQQMVEGDIANVGKEFDSLVIASNAGRTVAMTSNPYLQAQYKKWGLRPDNVYRCAINYLFKPNAQVMKKFEMEFNAINDPNTVSIGVQLRRGDSMFSGEERKAPPDSFYKTEFEHISYCAQQVEKRVAIDGRKPLWYVISDDKYYREYMKKTYPDKVLTRTEELTLMHAHFTAVQKGSEEAQRIDALQTVVGELWAYSKCDWYITMSNSGFARAAAAMSKEWMRNYDIPLNANMSAGFRSCDWNAVLDIYMQARKAPGI